MARLLAEDLLLLCWNDHRGAPHTSCAQALPPGIGGALALDALLAGTIAVDDGRVTVSRGDAVDDPLLAQVVATVGQDRRPPTMQQVVQRLGTKANVTAVAERLVQRGVLRAEDRKILWLFPVRRFPVADAGEAAAVREQAKALLAGHREPDPRVPGQALLAALAKPVGAIGLLFPDRAARKDAERRAEAFAQGHGVPDAVRKVVQQAQAAAMAAVTAAVAASTTTTSSGSS